MCVNKGFLRVFSTIGLLLCASSAIELYPIERPISWDNIFECYSKEIPAGSTFRSLKGEELYGVWKAEMKEKNIKIPDFIK